VDVSFAAAVEPRPFLFLDPVRTTARRPVLDEVGRENLESCTIDAVPAIVRSLVDFTIAQQNRRALEHGNVQPIQLSVLNRRRRSARAWILAVLAGAVDAGTLHALTTQWIPTLTGTGPDLRRAAQPGRACLEFLRGAIAAQIFDRPAENLLPHARALHVLETVLGLHLAAVQDAARASTAS
jgi:hypothetical protein